MTKTEHGAFAPVLFQPMLTRHELQGILKVSGRTIARLVACGDLPAPIKVGGSNRWRADDIAGFLGHAPSATTP